MRSGEIAKYYKVPLVFEPQPEGGFTVTSPLLPELITEGESVEDALEKVRVALAAVLEADRALGRPLPSDLVIRDSIAAADESLPIPAWHLRELEQRRAAAEAYPEAGIPWEVVKLHLREHQVASPGVARD
jgi:antitoxin HicB